MFDLIYVWHLCNIVLSNSDEVHLLATGLRHFLASSFSGRCLVKVCKLRLAITTPKEYISLKKD